MSRTSRAILLGAACCCLIASSSAQLLPKDDPKEKDPLTVEGASSLLDGSLLPEGAVLNQAVIPTYDQQHRMDSIMHALKLTVIDQNQIHADELRIDFFNNEQILNGRIITPEATYLQKKGSDGKPVSFVQTDKSVRMISDRLWATGTGLFFSLVPQHEQGFIYGPVRAFIHLDPSRKAMPSASSKSIRHVGLALAVTAAVASAQPAPSSEDELKHRQLTPEQIAQNQEQAKSKADGLKTAQNQSDEQTKTSLDQSAATDKKAASFLTENGIKAELAPDEDLNTAVPMPPATRTEGMSEITCDSGFYSDAEQNVLVFVKNVKIHSPEFNLEGANEVKAYMAPKANPDAKPVEADKKSDQKDKDKGNSQDLSGRMGAIKKVIATGSLKIDRPDDGKNGPMSGGGNVVIYDTEKKEVILMGKNPWVISPKASTTVIGEKGYIRYNTQTGEAVAGGGQVQTHANIDQKKK